MKNNDFDFIKEKFASDSVSAPDTLDENSARMMLDDIEPVKIKLYQKKSFKTAVSLAACFAVALCCVSSVFQNHTVQLQPSDDAQSNLSYFSSYDDIKNAVDNNKESFFEIAEYYFNDEKLSLTTDKSENVSAQVGTGSSHAETYTQVEGIDEADIIKNDGKYIYYVSFSDNIIRIYEGNKTSPKLAGKIDDFKGEGFLCDYTAVGEEIKRICDMYLIDNKLVVNVSSAEWKDEEHYINKTYAYVYDVTDVSNPKKLSSFTQSGEYVSSRMIGSRLYIVSSQTVQDTKEKDDYIPYTEVTGGKKEYLSPKDICCPESTTENSFIIISSVDINTGEKSVDSKAVFGAGTDIYCTNENMYIAVNKYGDNAQVDIIKASIADDDIKLKNSVTVNGSIDSQFSMDEYNGYFRIATTTEKYRHKNEEDFEIIRNNNLYVFDEQFNKIGEVTGFAKDESIKAVKFMGDIAYVITFESTDPLFVIDLSNPSKPKILGSVKIDGFSTHLLPIGDDKVLGIGYHEALVDEHEWESGIKLALFDVSDKTKPEVLDSYVLKYGNSDAQSNHKAIVMNKEKGYYAIDYTQNLIDDNGEDEEHAGAITFKVEKDKIVVNNKFDYIDDVKDDNYSPDASRCTYIDDTVYVLDLVGNIYAFEYKD